MSATPGPSKTPSPEPLAIGQFAWRVAAPREFVITGVINFWIALGLWRANAETPASAMGHFIVPMMTLMFGLTTFFGYFSGIRERRLGKVLPPYSPAAPWLPAAFFSGLCHAAVGFACGWCLSELLMQTAPTFALPTWLASLGIGLWAGVLAAPLHAWAVLRSGNIGRVYEPIDPAAVLASAGDGQLAVSLGTVQETLLIPLYLRAQESQRPDAILRDPVATALIPRLDYDFGKFKPAWNIQLDVCIRTEIIDGRIREFLARRPQAVVVSLGAGLDARHIRFAQPGVRWFDLDLPDVVALRRQVLRELPGGHTLDKSLFDPGWIDEIAPQNGEGVLLIAEGVFSYLPEGELRKLITRLADRLPGAELVFQSISPHYVKASVAAVNQTKATLEWGIHTARELETWDPRCQFVGEWCFLDRYPWRWGHIGWLALVPGYGRRIREVLKVSQVRFRGEAPAGP